MTLPKRPRKTQIIQWQSNEKKKMAMQTKKLPGWLDTTDKAAEIFF
jgi:hypothetical protein